MFRINSTTLTTNVTYTMPDGVNVVVDVSHFMPDSTDTVIRDELPHLQIFVAGVTSKAMNDHIPDSHRKEAANGGYLW